MSKKYYDIVKESTKFSLMIIDVYKYLVEQNEYVMSKQLLRSWTSIGANIKEAEQGHSKKDFLHKMSIALKEANETEYWLYLLYKGKYIHNYWWYEILYDKSKEMIWVLVKIVRTTSNNLKKDG